MTTVEGTFRLATEADADAIARIISRVIAEPNPVGIVQALTPEQVVGWIRRLGTQGCIFLAEVGGEIIGFAALDYNTEVPDTGTIGVWLLPEYRRRGLGTQLGECVLDFAREAGYKRVKGRLPDNNEPALSFLSSLGALVPLQNPEMRFELPL
jgi:RimJ/RimL family protein N-acetyltransferase